MQSQTSSPARRQPAMVERQQTPGSVSGQASAELRALLHQRLVMTEGGGSPERSVDKNPVPHLMGPMPVPMTRSSVVLNDSQAKAWMSARTVPLGRGTSTLVAAAPATSPATNGIHQKKICSSPALGMRLLDVNAQTAQKLQGEFRTATPGKSAADFRNGSVDIADWQKLPMEESLAATRLLPPERVSTRAKLQRGLTCSEADGLSRMKKARDNREEVSCGKLYEELAFLRKENMVLHRTCSELETRSKEEVPTQMMEEISKLRLENERLQGCNAELREKANERQEECIKLEELRKEAEKAPAPPEKLDDVEAGSLEELAAKLADAQRQISVLEGELSAERSCHGQYVASMRDKSAALQRKCSELEAEARQASGQRAELSELKKQCAAALAEKDRLSSEVAKLSESLKAAEERFNQVEESQSAERRAIEEERRELSEEKKRFEEERRRAMEAECRQPLQPVEEESPSCSQSRLRAVMTDRSATLPEMKSAIAAAEAFLNEAKRECEAKQLRERRACYERLLAAIEAEKEEELSEAVAAARNGDVDAEDIVKGEAKLALLRSLSDEQRQAKALHERSMQRRKEAYFLVKKDDAEGLRRLVEGLDDAIRWQDWRDYMGRTLWRFAVEMRALSAQEYLAPLLGMNAPVNKVEEREEPSTPPAADVPEPEVEQSPAASKQAAAKVGMSEQEEAELKSKAFRAVVQDNTSALGEILAKLEIEAWSKWENKAGKDLLTLSQERGSSGAYSVLAKALGLVQEQKREFFDEREAVWIFMQGEVQPRRATVLEDTPEEADDVLVEYWDGDEPAGRVSRCLVRKMWS